AYLGVPPVFIGELLMVSGCALLLICGRWWAILRMPQVIMLLVLIGWCVLRTLPFIRQYKIDALRDAILYVYAAFAFVVAGVMVTQPQLLATVVNRYRVFMKV